MKIATNIVIAIILTTTLFPFVQANEAYTSDAQKCQILHGYAVEAMALRHAGLPIEEATQGLEVKQVELTHRAYRVRGYRLSDYYGHYYDLPSNSFPTHQVGGKLEQGYVRPNQQDSRGWTAMTMGFAGDVFSSCVVSTAREHGVSVRLQAEAVLNWGSPQCREVYRLARGVIVERRYSTASLQTLRSRWLNESDLQSRIRRYIGHSGSEEHDALNLFGQCNYVPPEANGFSSDLIDSYRKYQETQAD